MNRLLTTLCLAALPSLAAAQSDVYTITNAGTVSRVNITTGQLTAVGTFAVGLPEGLAVTDDNQTLYVTNSIGVLHTISLSTLTVTASVSLGTGNVEGLDLIGGRLIGYGFGNNLNIYEINPAAGTATPIATASGFVSGAARSLAMQSETVGYVTGTSDLYRIDLTTGALTLVGPLGIPDTLFGMDFIDGDLIGIGSTSGAVYGVSTGTGAATWLGVTLPASYYLGLTAVPEPLDLVIDGELTATSARWDRPRDTGFVPGPCGASTAYDSFNDGQPYDRYTLTATNPALPVTVLMESLEPALVDFDPFLGIYCDPFDAGAPLDNALALDDDSGFDGSDLSRQDARLELTLGPGAHTLMASSYASWAPTKFGRYRLTLTNATATAAPFCAADVNGDGFLDNGDIGAFIAAFLAANLIADFNGDGFLDNGDINAFIAAFLAGC